MIDERAGALTAYTVDAFGGGLEDQATAFSPVGKPLFNFLALSDNGAENQCGKGQNQHQELENRQIFHSLVGHAHHEGQAGINQDQCNENASQAATNGNPDQRQEE